MGYFFSILGGWVFAELCGYFIHIVLHSEKVPYLARNHMIHHLKIYSPEKSLRTSDQYMASTSGRAAVLGIGMEWLGPIGLILGVTYYSFTALGFGINYFFVFSGSALLWGYFLFGYMHDAMHLRHFWMTRVPVLKNWYLHIRKLHDIHHLNFSDDGRNLTNYGICFFFIDRLFGTLRSKHDIFNKQGYQTALIRYSAMLQENRPN